MFSQWELIYDVLFAPRRGLRHVAQQRPLGWALFISGAAFATLVTVVLATKPFRDEAAFLFCAAFIAGLLRCFFMSAFWHLAASLLGGRGGVKGLLTALGYANLPLFLLLPLKAAAAQISGGSHSVLLTGGSLTILFWHVYLLLESVAVVHAFSRGRALLTMLLPGVFLAACVATLLLAAGIWLATKGGAV